MELGEVKEAQSPRDPFRNIRQGMFPIVERYNNGYLVNSDSIGSAFELCFMEVAHLSAAAFSKGIDKMFLPWPMSISYENGPLTPLGEAYINMVALTGHQSIIKQGGIELGKSFVPIEDTAGFLGLVNQFNHIMSIVTKMSIQGKLEEAGDAGIDFDNTYCTKDPAWTDCNYIDNGSSTAARGICGFFNRYMTTTKNPNKVKRVLFNTATLKEGALYRMMRDFDGGTIESVGDQLFPKSNVYGFQFDHVASDGMFVFDQKLQAFVYSHDMALLAEVGKMERAERLSEIEGAGVGRGCPMHRKVDGSVILGKLINKIVVIP